MNATATTTNQTDTNTTTARTINPIVRQNTLLLIEGLRQDGRTAAEIAAQIFVPVDIVTAYCAAADAVQLAQDNAELPDADTVIGAE